MAAKQKRETGRPTKFIQDYVDQVYKLCLLGATDKELADFFEVSEATLNTWKHAHPEFLESIKRGKAHADASVADRLFQRAMGYTHPEEKIFNAGPMIVRAPTTKHYPPDTAAAIFWLKNRQKDKWRDKLDHEIGGPNGGPLVVEVVKFAGPAAK